MKKLPQSWFPKLLLITLPFVVFGLVVFKGVKVPVSKRIDAKVEEVIPVGFGRFGEVEILRTELVPFVNRGTKEEAISIVVHWKNKSEFPIRRVKAAFRVWNEEKWPLDRFEYTIYAEDFNRSGVLPGETYEERAENGYIFPIEKDRGMDRRPKFAEVKILAATEYLGF